MGTGRHERPPEPARNAPIKVVRVVRGRIHVWLVFWKHMIVETSAGFMAIIVFEAYRSEWLGLLGVHHIV